MSGDANVIGGAVKRARDASRAATDLAHRAVSGIAGQRRPDAHQRRLEVRGRAS